MIPLNDPRYERAEHQEFGDFEEGDRLLRNYCGGCRKQNICRIKDGLLKAMGMNYPFWSRLFVKLELKSVNPERGLRESEIVCKAFDDEQLTFSFS